MRVSEARSGVKAGRWTILSRPTVKAGRSVVECRCECGRKYTVRVDTLPPTHSRASTQCRECASAHMSQFIRDGRSLHPLYETWRTMIRRCHDAAWAGPDWRYYGGRGITVCDRWRDDRDGLWNFATDVGDRPDGHTLDRIDVDGNYEPLNVRWATPSQQIANQSAGPF